MFSDAAVFLLVGQCLQARMKKTHGFHNLLFHAPFPTHPQVRVILILSCFTDYANCIISVLISFNSSNDSVDTQSAISSSVILPFLISCSAIALSVPCLSLLINDFIICSSSNKLIIIVTTSFSLCAKYSLKTFLSLHMRIVSVQRANCFYFFNLAYTSLMPSLIISDRLLPAALQQYSRISTSSLDIRILVSCFLGLSVGLPVLGDNLSSFFW